MSQHICIVMQEFIHKVRTIGGGRSASVQSVLARMGGGGEVQLELHVYYNSFAGTLQNKNITKKVSYEDSQNYPFPSPPYS